MRYIPHTDADRAFMLDAIGVASVDELFADVPPPLRLGRPLDVPEGLGESDLLEHMSDLAARNTTAAGGAISFLGGGVYRHYAPIAMDHLLLRGELYTAYTPYQPEVAQGTLQIIFEFQTMISELIGAEVVNASMYDGSTATAEAALMALRVKKRAPRRVIVSAAIHPEYRAVTKLFVEAAGAEIVEIPVDETGVTSMVALDAALAEGAACAIVGYPTFYGTLDDVAGAAERCHASGALVVATFQDALAFGLLAPPASLGADIVVGEGQALGVPASFGGPHLGLFGARAEFIRQMPGRIAGETVDDRGQRGFVLTMATREQHIRRDRATSNICTNQGLMATAATIYMTMLGPDGLEKVALACHLRAEQLKAAVCALPGYSLRFTGPTFHEAVIRCPISASAVVESLAAQDIAAGVALGAYDPALDDCLLVTATELTRASDIDALVAALVALTP